MIPIVDIGSYISATTSERGKEQNGAGTIFDQKATTLKETAKLLHVALCEHGFCFLTNHGVPNHVLEGVLSSSKKFFELPDGVKQKYSRPVEGSNHGWVASERENLNPERPHADLKEAFNFSPSEEGPWPGEVPDLHTSFNDIFMECQKLANCVFDLLSLAFEIEDRGFLPKCHQLMGKKGNYTTLRSLYYPPSVTYKEGQIQCGEHSDYGTVTLLFQDDTGGLQVLGKDGQYHDVTPVSGAVLVNIGDLMQRWTADKYPATKHRVIVPRQAAEQGRSRQSVAFFTQPDNNTLITCLDGSNKYPPVTSYDYVMQKFGVTY